MTVKELIEELKNFDEDATVITEGCDCNGDVATVGEQDGCVYLGRGR
jgi:hypothetical protein